jgi:hypothetical protein
MKDTLREQIVHILYGDWISYESIKKGKVAETDTKDVDAILSLIEEEKINIQIRVLENILESDSWDNPLLLRSLIKGNLATLNSKEQK